MSKGEAMKRLNNDNPQSKHEILPNLKGFVYPIIILSFCDNSTCKKSNFEVEDEKPFNRNDLLEGGCKVLCILIMYHLL